MFHIVEQKSSNAFDMRGIFIYLFRKSLTRESDLYIILYTEQKSEYNRENYGSVGNGCSTQTTETIFFYLIKIFFFPKKSEALKVHWEIFFLSQPLHWDLLPVYQNSWVPNILSSSFPHGWNIISAILIWEAGYDPGSLGHVVKSKLNLIITCLSSLLVLNLM